MSADDAQERTEDASPKKLRKARERGEVARSSDLTAALLLAVAAGGLAYGGGALARALNDSALDVFRVVAQPELNSSDLTNALGECAARAAAATFPLLIVLCASALVFPFLQVGPLIAFEPLKPKLERLDPTKGFKRLFASLETYVELGKSAFKLTSVVALAALVARGELARLLAISALHPLEAALTVASTLGTLTAWVIAFALGLGALDLFYQRWNFARRQRMSRQEVKREYKDDEGDPQLRHARRELHLEILESTMLDAVPTADLVARNPTHIACALRYDPSRDGAPRLVAKGQEALAHKIEELARAHGVPIVYDVPFARAVFQLELDAQIPDELFVAAVEVLRWAEAQAQAQGREVSWRRADARALDGGEER